MSSDITALLVILPKMTEGNGLIARKAIRPKHQETHTVPACERKALASTVEGYQAKGGCVAHRLVDTALSLTQWDSGIRHPFQSPPVVLKPQRPGLRDACECVEKPARGV